MHLRLAPVAWGVGPETVDFAVDVDAPACLSGVDCAPDGTRSSSQKSTEHMALLNTVILNKCQIKHCYFEHLPVEQE